MLMGRPWACLDVLAHEICHMFTESLAFSGQSGAISESVCDVLGLLVFLSPMEMCPRPSKIGRSTQDRTLDSDVR